MLCLIAQLCPTLCDPMECSPQGEGSSVHGASPGKNTGVGCHALFQGILPTQGLNLGLLHWEVEVLATGQPGKFTCVLTFNSEICHSKGQSIHIKHLFIVLFLILSGIMLY